MRRLFTLTAVCACLLSACQWNIGARIRSETAVHVGGDVRKPVGALYGNEKTCDRYAYVPELTYRMTPSFVEFCGMGAQPRPVRELTPTGRTVLVRIGFAPSLTEKVDALPDGAVALEKAEFHSSLYSENDHRWLGDFDGDEASRGSPGAQVLAAPFDYVIDPVLGVLTTPVWALGFIFYAACTGH